MSASSNVAEMLLWVADDCLQRILPDCCRLLNPVPWITHNRANISLLRTRKGVSFLSRIMGGTKREDSFDLIPDSESEIADNRPAGGDAEVFSQPIGFIPRIPPPPKYIKVKAQNRKQKDFDRVF